MIAALRAPVLRALVLLLAALLGGCVTTTTNSPFKADKQEEVKYRVDAPAAYLKKGNTEQAGFLINRLYRDYPDHLGTYTEGAEVLLIQGRVREAGEWLDRGLVRFPNNPILRNDRGMCRLLEANLPAATADFEAAYASDPGDADYVANLALARALAGDTDAARALWSRVLNPEDVEHNISQAAAAAPKFKRGQ